MTEEVEYQISFSLFFLFILSFPGGTYPGLDFYHEFITRMSIMDKFHWIY